MIAITGYKQIFNSNPRLDSAQTLILDDAHAAEDAVASNWSIDAQRPSLLHTALVAILVPYLPESLARRVQGDPDPFDPGDVALVPPEALAAVAGDIEQALSEYATAPTDPNAYTKTMIGSAFGRCLAYVANNQVLIRPMIAPTAGHAPFADAQQRVYMSATLGTAGEMQRAFGVADMTHIAPNAETEQSFGRRFFVMPHAARGRADDITKQAIIEAGRAVILTPSNRETAEAISSLVPDGTPVLKAEDVEADFDPFVSQNPAVLALANRYDGIDLPDDACRLVVLSGLPAYAHMQERFLMDWLGARRVLSERIRTRIQQGAGRATRNARDFAAVVVRSERLTDFLAREEEVEAMLPQLQAEIDFGFDNSEQPGTDLMELLQSFWNQGQSWQTAEVDLQARTAERARHVSAADRALANSAKPEVLCWRAVMSDDLPRAVDLAQQVTDTLIGGDELRPYRALWFYLAASWAWQLARTDPPSWETRARALQREAVGCAGPLRWTPRWVAEPIEATPTEDRPRRAERAADLIRRLGIRGARFDTYVEQTIDLLHEDEAGSFEEGVQMLGTLLGFEAVRPSGQADPDGAWRDDTRLWLLTEAKTGEGADQLLSVNTVRQASTHANWIATELEWESPERTMTIIVSYRTEIEPAAVPISGDLRLTNPCVIRDIARRTGQALAEARAGARGMSNEQFVDVVMRGFADYHLASDELLAELGARRISDG